MNRRKRGGIWAGAAAAGVAAVGAAVVTDRRVRATRTETVLDETDEAVDDLRDDRV